MKANSLPEMTASKTTAKNFTPDRKRFQEVIHPLTSALVLDEEGNICHITPAARRLLEYKAHQSVKSSFFAHIHSSNLYQVMRDVADMVCYGKAKASWLIRLRTGKNRWRWYKANAQNLLKAPAGAIAIYLRDLR
ncbi:hypothetical protein [Rhodocaloribacter sp.]